MNEVMLQNAILFGLLSISFFLNAVGRNLSYPEPGQYEYAQLYGGKLIEHKGKSAMVVQFTMAWVVDTALKILIFASVIQLIRVYLAMTADLGSRL